MRGLGSFWQSVLDYYHPGGVLIWVIFFASLVMWGLVFERFFSLRGSESSALQLFNAGGKGDGILGRVVEQLHLYREPYRGLLLEQLIANERHDLTRFESTIAVLSAVLPLLGLLGTVSGMIAMFDALSDLGMRDSHLVSQGLSQALLTTQVGLLTSLPGVWMLGRIAKKRRRIEYEFSMLRLLICDR